MSTVDRDRPRLGIQGQRQKMKSSQALAAAAIRNELKKNGIAARVTSDSASMTSSVRVLILQDVSPATRREVEIFAGRFQYGHFDGMTDSYDVSNRDDSIPQVKFVFVEVKYSDEIQKAARDYIANGRTDYEADRMTWQVLNGSYPCDFWRSRKPRVAVPASEVVEA